MNKAMAAHLEALGYAPEMLFQFWSLKTCWPSIWIGIHHSPGFNKKDYWEKTNFCFWNEKKLLLVALIRNVAHSPIDPRFEIFKVGCGTNFTSLDPRFEIFVGCWTNFTSLRLHLVTVLGRV
jgi:hypothetical protein